MLPSESANGVQALLDELRKEGRTWRAAILKEARAEVQRRMSRAAGLRVAPNPSPRYDEVFFEGTAQLDRAAGEPVTASLGELHVDDSVWLSAQRRDPGIS